MTIIIQAYLSIIPSHPGPSTSPRSHRFCPSPPSLPRNPAPAPEASTPPCQWARFCGRSWPLGGENGAWKPWGKPWEKPWENHGKTRWIEHFTFYQLMVGFLLGEVCEFNNLMVLMTVHWWTNTRKKMKKTCFRVFSSTTTETARTATNYGKPGSRSGVETGVQCNWSPDSSEKPHGQYHPQILVVNPSCSLHFLQALPFLTWNPHICLQNFPIQPHLLQLPKFS